MLPDRIDAGTLTLRWLTLRDAPAVQRHCADARVACMTAVIPHPYPDGAAAAWIAAQPQAREADGEFIWRLFAPDSDEPGRGRRMACGTRRRH